MDEVISHTAEQEVEDMLRAWFAKQEGYFGTSKGVENVSTGEVSGEGDPLFDGAVDVRNLSTFIAGHFVRLPTRLANEGEG